MYIGHLKIRVCLRFGSVYVKPWNAALTGIHIISLLIDDTFSVCYDFFLQVVRSLENSSHERARGDRGSLDHSHQCRENNWIWPIPNLTKQTLNRRHSKPAVIFDLHQEHMLHRRLLDLSNFLEINLDFSDHVGVKIWKTFSREIVIGVTICKMYTQKLRLI